MRTVYFQVSVPRVLATQVLGRLWRGAYLAPSAPVRMSTFQPTLPDSRWIVVRNARAGVCGSDLHLVHAEVDPRTHAAALPGRDRIYLGHEVVGRVEAVGDDVSAVSVGDRVLMQSRGLGSTCFVAEREPVCPYCDSGDYCLCMYQGELDGPVGKGGGWSDGYVCHESEVYVLSDGLDDDAAVLVEPLACGLRAVLRRPPAPGERVLVIGAGIIGLATLQAVRAVEPTAHVSITARYPQQIDAARRLGGDVIEGDLLAESAARTQAHLYRGLFGNRTLVGGYDVVYDCVASSRTLETALRLTAAGGAVVFVGLNLERMHLDLSPILLQEVDLVGTLAHGAETFEGERMSTFARTEQFIRDGRISTEGLITHRFPLESWREAVRIASDKRSGAIKVVFDIEAER